MEGGVPVLLLAHASPPLGGSAAFRIASWMRRWPEIGIEPLLVTAPPDEAARARGYPLDKGSDETLSGRTVVRVETGRPKGLAGALRAIRAPSRIVWTLAHGAVREPEAPWSRAAVAAAVALGRERGARAVVSSAPPFAAHVAGRAVAKALGVPWIADFRDPMTEAPGRTWPTRLHHALDRREERGFFRSASLVWASTESAAARWRERFPFARDRIRVRRSGVEPRSLPAGASPPALPPLRIGHVGRFPDSSPPRRLAFLDHRPEGEAKGRSPAPLFRALAKVRAEEPSSRRNVVWVTVGDRGPDPPTGVLHEHHPATTSEHAIEIAATCHALYLPLTAPGPSGAIFVPPRAYEYAALGRPVLVSGSPRETTEVLGPLARVAAPGDDATLARHVRALLGGEGSRPARPVHVPTRDEIAAVCAEDVRRLVDQAGPRSSGAQAGTPPAT